MVLACLLIPASPARAGVLGTRASTGPSSVYFLMKLRTRCGAPRAGRRAAAGGRTQTRESSWPPHRQDIGLPREKLDLVRGAPGSICYALLSRPFAILDEIQPCGNPKSQ